MSVKLEITETEINEVLEYLADEYGMDEVQVSRQMVPHHEEEVLGFHTSHPMLVVAVMVHLATKAAVQGLDSWGGGMYLPTDIATYAMVEEDGALIVWTSSRLAG